MEEIIIICYLVGFIDTWLALKFINSLKKGPRRPKPNSEWKEIMAEYPQWFKEY